MNYYREQRKIDKNITVRVSVRRILLMKKLLYGVAYYDEYMPYDRLQQEIMVLDIMMLSVGFMMHCIR